MTNHVSGKTIIITGAGGGFGGIVARKAAALGAQIFCADINAAAAEAVVAEIKDAGGKAMAIYADVTDAASMRAVADAAIKSYGAIDVMINNAGTMPLALMSDHAVALEKWDQCIDINFKGVVNGTVAVFDQMMAQGRGHVINISSIYGNFPVVGSAVYGATKAAVNYFSESLRVDARGKIKVTIIKPTGVPGTGLGGGILNPEATIGILGQNAVIYGDEIAAWQEGRQSAQAADSDDIGYTVLDPAYIADAIIHAINQPWGVSIGDITIRAAGDHYIL
jgi:NADP-dependent 3-hydroxy acid dehydrogenase YdfG